jgi:hypothetical protein
VAGPSCAGSPRKAATSRRRPWARRRPYITELIKRFGEYATDGLTIPPAAFDARVNLSGRGGDAAAMAGMAA